VRFFDPSARFLDWLASYAQPRIVFDVGCGEGHILHQLHVRNVKAIGIEPFWDQDREYYRTCSNAVFPMEAQRVALLRKAPDSLVLFCRPCHGGWVEEVIELLPHSAEVLYISKPRNVAIDLMRYRARQLPAPRCRDERVYRVERVGLLTGAA
jgi:hypothetical protein